MYILNIANQKIMDAFYMTVVIVAIVFLVLVLTLVGTLMTTKNKSIFPPISEPCPDYWNVLSTNPNGNGSVCSPNGVNIGPTANLFSTAPLPPGYDNTTRSIDFSHPAWSGASGQLCAQNTWANKNGIIWGGVSNFNGCTLKV